jgi:CRP-like cAMP-binding protein
VKSVLCDPGPDGIPLPVSEIALLSRLRPACLEQVLAGASVLEAEVGEEVVGEGSQTHALYFLLSGSLRVEKRRKRIATLANPGELFGEIAFVTGSPHRSTVRATSPARVLKIDRAITRALSDEQADHFEGVLYRFLAELLAARLEETSGRVAEPFRQKHKPGEPEVYRL